jgi:outer membrane lipoprotein-sorting protein
MKITTLTPILLAGIIFFASCEKETPASTPRRAIAVAGPDRLVRLPLDSALLDGNRSINPDGIINQWLWTKISGPASSTIVNSSAAKTTVKNLTLGTYQFELKVSYGAGIFSRDTVQVAVLALGACNQLPINITSGSATLTPFGSLSSSRTVQPVTAADKLVFAGGYIGNNTYSDEVDIYNFSTNTWSSAKLSKAESKTNITLGNKIVFIGKTVIDVYDAAANTWTVIPNLTGWAPLAAINNKVFFAGGGLTSSQLNIYDVSANTWSTVSLSEGRAGITAITVGDKIIFAGGYKHLDGDDYPDDLSKAVDVYNASTNSWSTSQLPTAAFGGSAAATGNKVVFHFEGTPDYVSIYDIAANSWSTAPLSKPRYYTKVISIGNKILVAGGELRGMASATVDIYDAASNSWSTTNLNYPGTVVWSAALGNKLLISNNSGYGDGNVFDVYDASTNTMSAIRLNYRLVSSPVVADNKIFFGGGNVGDIGGNYLFGSCQVWKLQF